MLRSRGARGPNQKNYTVRCDWCTEVKETARPETKFCSSNCRNRHHLYLKRFGYIPDPPPGPISFAEAEALELERLIRQERERRRKAKAYLDATGEMLPQN